MTNSYRICLFLSSLFIFTACSNRMTINKLTDQINQKLNEQKGDFAVAFKDLTTGEQILINDQTFFHAASTMKTPVMIEVYKQAAAGAFSLQDSLVIKNEFRSIVDNSI